MKGAIIKAVEKALNILFEKKYTRRGALRYILPPSFLRGAVVATADLVECHKIVAVSGPHGYKYHVTTMDPVGFWISEEEFLFGDWTPGRFAWEWANVQQLPEPVRVRGKQRLWNWEGPPSDLL